MITTLLRMHRWTLRFDPLIDRWAGSLLLLAVRWYVGWQFFKSGLVKVGDWNATLALFRDEYHVPVLPPELAAWLGASQELALPLLLAVGLFSRPAALALLGVNIMAVISYPMLFQFECPAALNDHFFWGLLLATLVAVGPGRLSLDILLGRRALAQG